MFFFQKGGNLAWGIIIAIGWMKQSDHLQWPKSLGKYACGTESWLGYAWLLKWLSDVGLILSFCPWLGKSRTGDRHMQQCCCLSGILRLFQWGHWHHYLSLHGHKKGNLFQHNWICISGNRWLTRLTFFSCRRETPGNAGLFLSWKYYFNFTKAIMLTLCLNSQKPMTRSLGAIIICESFHL